MNPGMDLEYLKAKCVRYDNGLDLLRGNKVTERKQTNGSWSSGVGLR